MINNILDFLENTAHKYPQKTAFADINDEISFERLMQMAKSAGSFIAQKAKPLSPVVFFTEKSTACAAGFLGAVYAGCFYVLIDIKHPLNRIQAILQVLNAEIIITDEQNKNKLKDISFDGKTYILDNLFDTDINETALYEIKNTFVDTSPLYAIFTSGSTGVPKGVVVSHRSVIDFISVFTETFKLTSDDVIANQAPFDFDVSVKDFYSALAVGATVQIVPRAFFSFPTKLMDFLCERKVTTLIWAVSALCFVTTMKGLDYKVPYTINKIMFSGEVMPIKHLNIWRSFLPDATYVNLYGPTEITCNCTYYKIDRQFEENEALPLGVPFKNEKVFLLDENNCLVTKADILGEICVGGTALSLGYYNDPIRTAQSFVQNPLNKAYNETIYRTGDLARYSAKGELFYVTRKDFQIKHMGHRIELGEIEAAVNAIDDVDRACCIYFEEKQKIAAFVTGRADKKSIMAELKLKLPFFMLPNIITLLENMPMTKNGKIDRAYLKNMQILK